MKINISTFRPSPGSAEKVSHTLCGLMALSLFSACTSTKAPTTPAPAPVSAIQAQPTSGAPAQAPIVSDAPTVTPAATTATAAADTANSAQQPHSPVPVAATAQTQHQPSNLQLYSSTMQQTAPAGSAAVLKTSAANDSETALMRVEIMALKEKVAGLQRKLDLILRGQRSGLYEADNLDTIRTAVRDAEPKKNIVPGLASEGPIDRFENDFEKTGSERTLAAESPQRLLDRALNDLAQGDFARVAQSLEGFQQRFPNNPLSNAVELTLAEAYVELKSPQSALPHLRTFYLQHPNDVQIHRAKWLEARVQEQLQAPQKAAQLYREVIALAPQSDVALRARAALEKISGGATQ